MKRRKKTQSSKQVGIPKRRIIKDPVWGNVHLLSWERTLVNHFIFNRLHNVIQNSSGFRAYPGLRSSRFIHTIGVKHVATQMFINASVNADKAGRTALRREAASVSHQARETLHVNTQGYLAELAASFACPPEFLLLLAVLRVGALIHDIGHLPFSHIFENALEVFLDKKKDRFFKIKKGTQKLRNELLENLAKIRGPQEIVDSENLEKTPKSRAYHEIVGLVLAEQLRRELKKRQIDLKDAQAHSELEFASFLLECAIAMLRGDSLPITRSAISGTIDADRIDFTNRDGISSGLFRSGIDFGRLFALYTVRRRAVNSRDYWITPSPRTISDTEKLLWERFQDYRYINAHHKVHLYDEILENMIVEMLGQGQLDDFLKDLNWLLTPGHPTGSKGGIDDSKHTLGILLEFDDTWLESRIRSVHKQHVTGVKVLPPNVAALFEAYIEDRQKFKSVFKTDEDFWQKFADTHTLKSLRVDEIRPRSSEKIEVMKYRRGLVQEAVEKAKFLLQKQLSAELAALGVECVVLIGSTRRKIRYGIKNEEEATELGVASLRDLLRQKKYETAPFNCWYTLNDTARGKDLRVALINAIDGFLTTELSKMEIAKATAETSPGAKSKKPPLSK